MVFNKDGVLKHVCFKERKKLEMEGIREGESLGKWWYEDLAVECDSLFIWPVTERPNRKEILLNECTT